MAVLVIAPALSAVVSISTVAVAFGASVGRAQTTLLLVPVVHSAVPGVTASIRNADGIRSLSATPDTGRLSRLRTVRVKRTASPTVTVSGDAVLVIETLFSAASKAPTSQRASCGRATPRWSTPLTGSAAQSASEPASIATLPAFSAMVCVGPPLLASISRFSASTVTGAPPTSRLPLPQLVSVARLLDPFAEPLKPAHSPGVPLLMSVLISVGTVPVVDISPPAVELGLDSGLARTLFTSVLLMIVSAPRAWTAPPAPLSSPPLPAPVRFAVNVLLTIVTGRQRQSHRRRRRSRCYLSRRHCR